ncbi:hypothetical protein MMC11_008375 [Xylographa trunciseda]|nr:hypothetical protein [Xylographa trunciseda]
MAVGRDLYFLHTELLSNDSFDSAKTWTEPSFLQHHKSLLSLVLLSSIILSITYTLLYFPTNGDGLPVVNRRFALEPRVFARIRWATQARNILEDANDKFQGRAYRLERGDTDLVVLPPLFITELNRLPQNMISSRQSHASTLLGHLNGMDVVLKTNHHVKMLLNRITPALPELLKPSRIRIEESLTSLFPQSTDAWIAVKPVDKIVLCISRGITLATFGTPTCDDPELVRTFMEHTRNVFSVAFTLRLVPWFLQPILVWLHPHKWCLRQTWKTLERFVLPEVARRLSEKGCEGRTDLISCMVREAKDEQDADPQLIKGIVGSTAAGATYSSAALIVGVVADLLANPHFLEEVREEIRAKHQKVDGNWDIEAFNGLEKLDSAMKETVRLAPGTYLVYSRVMLNDHTLSDGLKLKKGQFVCISGYSRATDPTLFPNPKKYDALRAYKQNLQDHRARPFSSVLADDFRWGAGRWACPGRYIATLFAKIILVKLLDEYEFKLIDGVRPPNALLHEFVFFHPDTELLIRRRETNSGIVY